ncbi:hypothetical protein FPZ12_024105 [Amycolatopsis acidicola]|uniref:Uncharacterized protein n=1 Tax=Amycolatopsis acidicola TaxID=2596893 RepID=A0A5N0UX67_9PSEU|nr:hypothetical protein [Amycolatopsis acidicola]KAA9157968.1 hypothetical protein FPZ12_024105 [Amycolatopsis acidicola]
MSETRAQPGEYYVELAPHARQPRHRVSFPARIEHDRAQDALGAWWIRPSMRAAVVEDLRRWLQATPDVGIQLEFLRSGANLRSPGDVVVQVRDHGSEHWQRIRPDRDGRYPVGGDPVWPWFLSVPTTSALAIFTTRNRLLQSDRLRAEPAERHVALDGRSPGFPAIVGQGPRNGILRPRFRPAVAASVLAWANDRAMRIDPDFLCGYWENDTIVLLDGEHIDEHGYQPTLIQPDHDGRYAVAPGRWAWCDSVE